MSIHGRCFRPGGFWAAALTSALTSALAAGDGGSAAFPARLTGDLGGMVYATGTPIRGEAATVLPLPYGYFDYQRCFVRIDTLGVKGFGLGHGHLELVTRVGFDRLKADAASRPGIEARKNSLPLGLGTYQPTPVGALFLYAFHDFGGSGGNLYECSFATRLAAGALAVYPRIGLDHRTRAYFDYHFGVTSQEALGSGLAPYRPGAGTMPFASLLVEVPVGGSWYCNLQLRRDWLPAASTESPLVAARARNSAFLALARRFR